MPTAHPRPWHREALFGDGPRIPMCRERRAVWRVRLMLFRRARKITPLFEDIGLAMLRRLGADGRLDPSHQTVADDVGCSPRTVRRALAAFADKAIGLVFWIQRLVRDGRRVEQTSNAYVLTLGNPPAIPALTPGGQIGRGTRRTEIISVQQDAAQRWAAEVSPEARQEARAALARIAAQRQAVIQARLLTRA
jgi:hypothetical protein